MFGLGNAIDIKWGDMPKNKTIKSSDIVKAMEKALGCKARTSTLEIKYQKEVGEFVQKIEDAHKQAAKSKLVF